MYKYMYKYMYKCNLSASGSLARMYEQPFLSAVSNERFNAVFPSSGLGKGAVGNSGSGCR